jgi:hypothetical protein
MKRLLLAGLVAILVSACQPADGDDPTPTLDTLDSGAPLEGVGPGESQDEIGDEGP